MKNYNAFHVTIDFICYKEFMKLNMGTQYLTVIS